MNRRGFFQSMVGVAALATGACLKKDEPVKEVKGIKTANGEWEKTTLVVNSETGESKKVNKDCAFVARIAYENIA